MNENFHTINLGDAVEGTPELKDVFEATAVLIPNPQWWINWPVMPLKNRNGQFPNNLGYLLVDPMRPDLKAEPFTGPYVVRDGNVFAPNVSDPILGTYATVAELMGAGWIVD